MECGMSAAGARIMVVDDEEVICRVVTDFFNAKGFEADAAGSAEEAMGLLAGRSYDLVLSDIVMPETDGMKLLERITREHGGTPVIMMTGYAEIKTSVDAMKMGAYDYITKPFDYDELLICTERALERARLVRLEREYNETLERRVFELGDRIRNSTAAAIASLTNAIEAKDYYIRGHSIRVTRYSGWLSDRMGIDHVLKNDVTMAAQLHDIGKLGIADAVLNKPSRLTDKEYDTIKEHPLTSVRILEPVFDGRIIGFVRSHHERWDGKGYPDGLSGDEIPMGARIIAVADAFDAMTCDRAYRKSISPAMAVDEILHCSGTQFDPALVSYIPPILEQGLVDFDTEH